MLGGLVFIVLPLAVFAFYANAPARGWREAGVIAALAWAAGVALVTEGLSIFDALRFGPALIIWLLINLTAAAFAWHGWRNGARPPRLALACAFERLIAVVVIGLLGLALVVAIASPPNTPDALSYHLPRQVMWLQQGNVRHFVTVDDRALMMPPLAEMIQAHAMLLSGGDWWANFPQWVGYALGCIIASLLARELGAGRRGQGLAAVGFATLPMAYLEASSAKNDLLVAVWLAALVWLGLRLKCAVASPAPRRDWIATGTALGVALATKTTAFVFAAPVLVWLAPKTWREARRAWWVPVLALGIAGPHWSRNVAWYGTPLGIHRAEDGGAQAGTLFTWQSTLSNLVRNLTLHTGMPSPGFNAALTTAVEHFHRGLGLATDDERTTLIKLHYDVEWLPRSEAVAGAPVACWLGLAAGLGLLGRGPRRGPAVQLLFLTAAAGLLYCVVLKWQPWGARLHLPLFFGLVALSAWTAERIGTWAMMMMAGLCVAGWLPSAEADRRPWWTAPTIFATPRWENYFRYHEIDQPPTETCVRALVAAKVESLQIVTKHDLPYPLMRRYLAAAGPRARIWGALPAAATTFPEAVVVMEPFDHPLPLYLHLAGAGERYRATGPTEPIGLYVLESRSRAVALPLPSFVGWDTAENLSSLELEVRGSPPRPVRRLLAPETRLGFRREAAHERVRIEVTNISPTPCELELRLDGARVAHVRFEPDAAVQIVEVPLAPAGERAELTLAVVSGPRSALHLTALQIID